VTEVLTLDVVQARFAELIDRVSREQDRIVVTRDGEATAVLISADDLEALEETLAILSDSQLLARVREGEQAAARGDVASLADVRADLAGRPATD